MCRLTHNANYLRRTATDLDSATARVQQYVHRDEQQVVSLVVIVANIHSLMGHCRKYTQPYGTL